jgi:hypothetical protein
MHSLRIADCGLRIGGRASSPVIRTLAPALIALLGTSVAARAANATIERLDGSQISGAWIGIGDSGEIILETGGRQQKLPADEVREVRFGAAPATEMGTKPAFVLELADGGHLPVRALKSGSGAALTVETALSPELTIGFKHLAALRVGWLADNAEAAKIFDTEFAQRQPGKDVLIASVRDGAPRPGSAAGAVRSVRGSLIALDADSGRFNFGGAERAFRVDDLFAIIFAKGATAPPQAPTELHLFDGTLLRGSLAPAAGDQLTLNTTFGAALTVPLARVQFIGLVSGRVTLLSELTPTRTNTEGLLHAPWPVRKDRSVSNSPLILGGKPFAHGLGVHSKCELTYELDGAFERLTCVIGIDDAVRPLGNVIFRVTGDGRTLFDSGPITGNDEPKPISIDISGVKQLALLVDYGEQMDLSDQADWADLRLIRAATAAQPTVPRR